jgi:hypothetical protein
MPLSTSSSEKELVEGSVDFTDYRSGGAIGHNAHLGLDLYYRQKPVNKGFVDTLSRIGNDATAQKSLAGLGVALSIRYADMFESDIE